MTRFSRFLAVPAAVLLALLALLGLQRSLQVSAAQIIPVSPSEAQVCQNGMAGSFPCERVDLLSFLSDADLSAGEGGTLANLWGWSDPQTGKEYVLQALTSGLVFVDISDPLNPLVVGRLPNATATLPTTYRDIKVYGNYAYVIADANSLHGMQVFDLTQLRDVITPSVVFTHTAYFGGFGNAHNLFINQDSGYAYVARTTTPLYCDAALYMLDLHTPLTPTFAGCYAEGGLASDSMCAVYHGPDAAYQDHEICLVASDDNILVADMSDKANPLTLASLTYDNISRAHLVWMTDDQRYFLSVDMDDEHHHGLNTRIFIWDMTQVSTPTLKGIYEAPFPASDHSVWIKGDYAYITNFQSGLRILDLRQIDSTTLTNTTVTQAAFFDMYPRDDNPGHGGAWAAYPFFESGVLPVSVKEVAEGEQPGLYLLRPQLNSLYLPLVSKGSGL